MGQPVLGRLGFVWGWGMSWNPSEYRGFTFNGLQGNLGDQGTTPLTVGDKEGHEKILKRL